MADPFVGEVRTFAFRFPPAGWAFCDGQIIPFSQNTALFSILGNRYGGDPRFSFALPNLTGMKAEDTAHAPAGDVGYLVMNFCIAMQGVFPPRP